LRPVKEQHQQHQEEQAHGHARFAGRKAQRDPGREDGEGVGAGESEDHSLAQGVERRQQQAAPVCKTDGGDAQNQEQQGHPLAIAHCFNNSPEGIARGLGTALGEGHGGSGRGKDDSEAGVGRDHHRIQEIQTLASRQQVPENDDEGEMEKDNQRELRHHMLPAPDGAPSEVKS